jgi:hypothetical protein
MTAENSNNRPDCDGILERKRHWSLEPTHLNDNPFVKTFAEKCLEMESLENFFITRFIIFKFKHLMKDFGINELNLKKLIEPKISVEPKMNETTGPLSMLFKKLFNSKKYSQTSIKSPRIKSQLV